MRTRAFLLLSLLFGSLTLAVSCATVSPTLLHYKIEVTPQMEKKFLAAEDLYRHHKDEEAAKSYRSYISEYRYNRLTDKAYYRLGSIFLRLKQFDTAYDYFRKTTQRNFHPKIAPWAQYRGAICLHLMEEYAKSDVLLSRIPSRYQVPALRIRLHSLHLENLRQMGTLTPLDEIEGYLHIYDSYTELGSEESNIEGYPWFVSQAQAIEKIRAWVAEDQEDPRESRKLMEEFSHTQSGGYVLWKFARRNYENGNYTDAKEAAARYLQLYSKHEYVVAAQAILLELEKRFGDYRIPLGVVLPLSGPYALYGESVLHGIECAAGVFSPCPDYENSKVRLIIRDSSGTPQGAANAVKSLAENEEVLGIVGPLLRREVDKAVEEAEAHGIPIIALTQNAEIAQKGQFVFQNFLTIGEQVQTVVNYSCDGRKLDKFAILYPDTSVGNEFYTAFQSAVARCGGRVVAEHKYSPDEEDYRNVVRGIKFAAKRHSYRAGIDFEALFIPDVYTRVAKILPLLESMNVTGVQLLGSAGWNHPSLASDLARQAQGSVFVAGYTPNSSYPESRRFSSRFLRAYNFDPTLLEAYGYDSLNMMQEVLGTMANKEPPTRRVLQQGLLALKGLRGATGAISVDEYGRATRDLFLMTVNDGELREVSPW